MIHLTPRTFQEISQAKMSQCCSKFSQKSCCPSNRCSHRNGPSGSGSALARSSCHVGHLEGSFVRQGQIHSESQLSTPYSNPSTPQSLENLGKFLSVDVVAALLHRDDDDEDEGDAKNISCRCVF